MRRHFHSIKSGIVPPASSASNNSTNTALVVSKLALCVQWTCYCQADDMENNSDKNGETCRKQNAHCVNTQTAFYKIR